VAALLLIALACAPTMRGATTVCWCVSGVGSIEAQVSHAKQYSDAVFAGSVIRVDSTSAPYVTGTRGNRSLYRRATMVLRRQWKGALPDTVEVWTPRNGAMCGYEFEMGKSYLVFARLGETGRLHTGLCTLTQSLGRAARYVLALGEPVVPVVDSRKPEQSRTWVTKQSKDIGNTR